MWASTFQLIPFLISEYFYKIPNNLIFSYIIRMENTWPPCLKDATKLSPSLVFSPTFFYLLVNLFSGQHRHISLLSKKSAAVLYLFKVFHTSISKVRLQFDLFLNVFWQLIMVISIVKNNKTFCLNYLQHLNTTTWNNRLWSCKYF